MNKYKNLAFNTMIFALGSFGSKIIMFFLTRLYTTYMPADMLGSRELIEITATFLVPIFSFSMSESIIRYGLDRDYDNKQVFSTACVTQMMGLGVMALISPLFSFIPFIKGFTPLLVVYVCTSAFRLTSSNFVRARGFVKLFALDGILTTITFFLFNLLFISGCKMGIEGFMLAVILSDFCSGVFLWIVAGLAKYFSIKSVDRDVMKTMLRFSLPLIPTAVMWQITGFSDRIFVKYMDGPEGLTGDSAAGIYTAAAKVPNLVQLVTTVFFQAWNMSAITEHNSKGAGKFFGQVFSTYQSLMFIASSFLILLMQPISAILLNFNAHPEYREVFSFTPGLVIAVLYMSLNQFLSSIYTATQKTKNSFWTSFAATVVNLILNVILIKLMGIQGAIIATFASYAVCYCIRIYDTRRYIHFDVNHAKTIINTALLFVMCLIAINRPHFWALMLTALTITICAINFMAVIETLKKLVSRRK